MTAVSFITAYVSVLHIGVMDSLIGFSVFRVYLDHLSLDYCL